MTKMYGPTIDRGEVSHLEFPTCFQDDVRDLHADERVSLEACCPIGVQRCFRSAASFGPNGVESDSYTEEEWVEDEEDLEDEEDDDDEEMEDTDFDEEDDYDDDIDDEDDEEEEEWVEDEDDMDDDLDDFDEEEDDEDD